MMVEDVAEMIVREIKKKYPGKTVKEDAAIDAIHNYLAGTNIRVDMDDLYGVVFSYLEDEGFKVLAKVSMKEVVGNGHAVKVNK